MKKTILALCILTGLVGCSSVTPSNPVIPVRVDPSWPDPISEWSGKWEVKVIDGKAWVGMSYENSQKFRIWLNDVSRYVQDANSMICYYRSPLKEKKCHD